MVQLKTLFTFAALSYFPANGIELDVSSADSVKSAASTIASGLVKYYQSNEPGRTGGLLNGSKVDDWWVSGAVLDTLVQYWRFTGDSQYNGIVSKDLLSQQGPDSDFRPLSQVVSEANEDQGVWALTAMSAAELQLPGATTTEWFNLADRVFNEYVARWDTATCGGGLRWLIYAFGPGYTYKDAASNGVFFQLSSRLGRYTGNSTYSKWASTAFNWSTTIGIVDDGHVYDGTDTKHDCTVLLRSQFSYKAGLYISGAAYMYNITTGATQTEWKKQLDSLLNQTLSIFFSDGVVIDICEPSGKCNFGMQIFKGRLGQALIDAVEMAPYTSSIITPKLASSAKAAAKACSQSGKECPFVWTEKEGRTSEPSIYGQFNALSFVPGLLAGKAAVPIRTMKDGNDSASTTGPGASSTSTGGPSATPTNTSMNTRVDSMSMAVMACFTLIACLLL